MSPWIPIRADVAATSALLFMSRTVTMRDGILLYYPSDRPNCARLWRRAGWICYVAPYDQSDAGSVGIFSRRTNRTQPARKGSARKGRRVQIANKDGRFTDISRRVPLQGPCRAGVVCGETSRWAARAWWGPLF
eukprot:1186154-Prorocentrum_minimum.AAC.1